MNAGQIEAMLCERAREVVEHLFPAAKFHGGEAKVGSIAGEAGESLSIRISGSKIGAWSDFSANLKGRKLVGLWHTVRGGGPVAFPKTLEEAAKWLGVYQPSERDFRNSIGPTVRQEPVVVRGLKAITAGDKIHSHLTMERELSQKSIDAYKIQFGSCKVDEKDGKPVYGDAIFFPYYEPQGRDLELGKWIALQRKPNGKKIVTATAGATKRLFGKHVVPADGGDLYITEGEIDAMSMFEMGYPAVSVPFGAKWEGEDGKDPNDEWIENDFDWLECFTRIYLCMDNDDEGKKATASIIKRLGTERCFVVKMPDVCKDANDVLVKGMGPDLFENINSAETVDPAELKNADKFRDQVWDRFNPQTRTERGIPFIFDIPWRNRRGELTIWTGFSGHGKSELLGCYMVYLASLHEKNCIASFEIPAADTLHNMTLQAAGRAYYQEKEEFDKDFNWLCQSTWVIDRIGRFSWKDMLEIFRYARRRYGITQFVVDSLMRCGIEEDDYQGQKDFTEALCNFAIECDAHVHLVAHSRKKEDESRLPGKQDVSGSAHLTNAASNGVTVYRNKGKEEKLDECRINGQQPTPDITCLPDGFFKVWKQRATGDEPKTAFYFTREVRQFSDRREPSKRYVKYPDEIV